MFVFTLPLGLFGVATAGSAVWGVKVCSDMANTSTPESALKLTVFPQTFSSTLQAGSVSFLVTEPRKKVKEKNEKAHLTQVPAFHAAFV